MILLRLTLEQFRWICAKVRAYNILVQQDRNRLYVYSYIDVKRNEKKKKNQQRFVFFYKTVGGADNKNVYNIPTRKIALIAYVLRSFYTACIKMQ